MLPKRWVRNGIFRAAHNLAVFLSLCVPSIWHNHPAFTNVKWNKIRQM